MQNDSALQPNLEQDEFDKRMLAMSDKQRKAMVKRLGDLARSKLGSEPSSSAPDTSAPSSQKSE